jgi:hypothetical protein
MSTAIFLLLAALAAYGWFNIILLLAALALCGADDDDEDQGS